MVLSLTNFLAFTSAKEIACDSTLADVLSQQSGTGRKTFQAKRMPFWKEKSSNLTISLWMDFPSN